MSANKLYKFRRIEDALNFLNGGVVGGSINKGTSGGSVPAGNMVGIAGLVGTTLIFTSPSAVTVTFVKSNIGSGTAVPPGTNPDPYTLFYKDIVAQVEAAIPAVKVLLTPEQNLLFIEATPASGVTISAAGTANSLLGLDDNNAMVGKIYKPAVVSATAPCWTWAYSGNDNMHNVYTWE
jgi:hypothetical protein